MKTLFGICAGVLASRLAGQDATIRTTVPLVAMPTSVTEKGGDAISGLSASDFILLDNGKKKNVNIDVVDSGLPPIALIVLIQTSDISLPALGKIRKVGALISQSVAGENGEVAVVTFSDEIAVVQDFTRDADKIQSAFAALKASNSMGGRMLDAVNQSLRLLSGRPGSRRSNILIIGESKDRGSSTKLEDIRETLQRTGVTVYGLKYSAYWTAFTTKPDEYRPAGGGLVGGVGELGRLGKQNTVEALTSLTGGLKASFQTKSKLEEDLMQLSKDVHNRYLVSFVPDPASTPNFHHISIQIRNHPNATVRTRPGYWAGL